MLQALDSVDLALDMVAVHSLVVLPIRRLAQLAQLYCSEFHQTVDLVFLLPY